MVSFWGASGVVAVILLPVGSGTPRRSEPEAVRRDRRSACKIQGEGNSGEGSCAVCSFTVWKAGPGDGGGVISGVVLTSMGNCRLPAGSPLVLCSGGQAKGFGADHQMGEASLGAQCSYGRRGWSR